jgi:site-specific DNA recombinase
LNQGDKVSAAALNRVPAIEIETLVLAAIKEKLGSKQETGIMHPESPSTDGELIRMRVVRIVVRTDEVVVTLRERPLDAPRATGQPKRNSPNRVARKIITFSIPWRKRPSKLPREIIRPVDPENSDRRPIRSETRATLVKAIANGRRWLEELITSRVISTDQIASREKCSVRQVNRIMTLAFLAPDLVQAAVEGRLPRGIGVEALRDCPVEWRQQRQMLGLA